MEYVAALCAAVALLAIVFAVRGARGVDVRREEISFPQLPSAFDGVSLVVLSDLHDRPLWKKDLFFEKVKACHPRAILLPGDLHNNGCMRRDWERFLKKLVQIAPVFYVTGNHEAPVSSEEGMAFLAEAEACGATLLGKTPFVLEKDGARITLIGADWNEEPPLPNDDFTVCVVHAPSYFDTMKKTADLTVSGHIPGGFIELPLIGAVFAPGEGRSVFARFHRTAFFPKYYKGTYTRGDKRLFVSRGLGFTFLPVRFFPAEIGQIILKKDT